LLEPQRKISQRLRVKTRRQKVSTHSG